MKAKKTYTLTRDQLKDLDKIRCALYLLSREDDLPRPVDEQLSVAVNQLYRWMQQFVKLIPVKEHAKHEDDGIIHEWPDTHYELWEAHK